MAAHRTVRVTTLEDDVDCPGSLRALLQHREPQCIRFAVSGTIHLRERLTVKFNHVVVDGEDSPGPVVLSGAPVIVRGQHVTLRFFHVHYNAPDVDEQKLEDEADALWVLKTSHVLIEHMTVLFGPDETLSVTKSDHVVVQKCVIGCSLTSNDHAFGTLLDGGHDKATILFQQNIICNNTSRNPSFGSGRFLAFNNLVANYGHRASYSSNLGTSWVILMNNYYEPGVDTQFPLVAFRAPDKPSRLRLAMMENQFLVPVNVCELNTTSYRNFHAVQKPEHIRRLACASPLEQMWHENARWTVDSQSMFPDERKEWQDALDFFSQRILPQISRHTLLKTCGAYVHPDEWHQHIIELVQHRKLKIQSHYTLESPSLLGKGGCCTVL